MPFDPISYMIARKSAQAVAKTPQADGSTICEVNGKLTLCDQYDGTNTVPLVSVYAKQRYIFHGTYARPIHGTTSTRTVRVLTNDYMFSDGRLAAAIALAKGYEVDVKYGIDFFVRAQDAANMYNFYVYNSDEVIQSRVGGTLTTLANTARTPPALLLVEMNVAGSTLTYYESGTALASATDTSFAAGYWGGEFLGIFNPIAVPTAVLAPPRSTLRRPAYVVEAPVCGKGDVWDPRRPCGLDAVPWGAFEATRDDSTFVAVVYGDLRQTRGVRIHKTPRNYGDAAALYKRLRADHPEWLAGKDNFVYHVLGHEAYEALQVADFYAGFLIDHRTRPQYDQLRRVPDWIMRKTVNMWLERLRRLRPHLPPSEADKHEDKLRRVLRLGW